MRSIRDEIAIVRARPDDAAALSAIASAAKAHWGYPAPWLAQWSAALTITPEMVVAQETFQAMRDGRAVGFYSLRQTKGAEWELDHLWVLPSCLRQGLAARYSLTPSGKLEPEARGA